MLISAKLCVTLSQSKSVNTHTHIHSYYIHVHVHDHDHAILCVCVCVCVCEHRCTSTVSMGTLKSHNAYKYRTCVPYAAIVMSRGGLI